MFQSLSSLQQGTQRLGQHLREVRFSGLGHVDGVIEEIGRDARVVGEIQQDHIVGFQVFSQSLFVSSQALRFGGLRGKEQSPLVDEDQLQAVLALSTG